MQGKILATRGGGRRKFIAPGALTVLAFAIAVPMIAGGAAGSVPSSNINDYALYAYQTIQLKGGSAPGRSIIDGNIGAGTRHYVAGNMFASTGGIDEWGGGTAFLNNSKTPVNSGDPHIILCQGSGNNGHINLINGSYVAAPSVQINYVAQAGYSFEPPTLLPTDPCQVPSVYSSATYKSFNMPHTVNHMSGFTPPDVVMPALPTTSCVGAQPVTSASYQAGGLKPGVYTKYTVTLSNWLWGGSFTFCGGLTVEQGASLHSNGPVTLNVVGSLNIKGGTTGSTGDCTTRFNVSDGVTFGRNANVFGTILAPNTDVALGDDTNIHGHVWAKAMHSDVGVNVGPCPPPGTTTTTSGATTTTLSATTTTRPATTTTLAPTTTTTRPATTTTTLPPTTTTKPPATTTTLGDT
jgi:hypothetical protein